LKGSYKGDCFSGHSSQSHTCLDISNEKFLCRSCGVAGDVITLVELVKFGASDKATFVQALNFLAERAGLKGSPQFSEEKISSLSNTRRAQEVLTAAALFYNSALKSEHIFYLESRGFNSHTIDKHKIGYASGQGLVRHLQEHGFTIPEIMSSGLCLDFGKPVEFFKGRITIPYLVGRTVQYFIARKTPWTPKKSYEEGKYKKLLTFKVPNEKIGTKGHPHIDQGIKNIIYNQNALIGATEVVITEGVLDCLTLEQHGISSISPVTVRFSHQDELAVLNLLRKDQTIYICNDNELSGAGDRGATSMARFLVSHGYYVKIVKLPLGKKNEDARGELGKQN
jgi:DNA primase